MPITKPIKVIKVPLSRDKRHPDRPQAFPRMPVLYLELLENKAKIKQDLINKQYKPTNNEYPFQAVQHSRSRPSPNENKTTEFNKLKKHENTEIKENFDDKSSHSSVGSISSTSTPKINIESPNNSNSPGSPGSPGSHGSHGSVDSQDSYDSRDSHSSQDNHDSSSESEKEEDDDHDELSERLKELLADTDNDNSSVEDFDSFKNRKSSSTESSTSTVDKYKRHIKSPLDVRSSRRSAPPQFKSKSRSKYHRTPGNRAAPLDSSGLPPTLDELKRKGHINMDKELRDVNHVTMDEQEISDKKREILFKFDLLRKSYRHSNSTIPEFTIHSDLTQMQKEYDSTVRRLSLDSTVESYKQYLIGGFMVTEFVFGNFLGFDMQGFTQQQIISMSSYERLLIELGEKSYVPSGSKWPVELRLLFMIIMNAAFFIVSKIIMRKTGADLMNTINSMNSRNTATSRQQAAPARKRRMRGPNIDLDDIPEAEAETKN